MIVTALDRLLSLQYPTLYYIVPSGLQIRLAALPQNPPRLGFVAPGPSRALQPRKARYHVSPSSDRSIWLRPTCLNFLSLFTMADCVVWVSFKEVLSVHRRPRSFRCEVLTGARVLVSL